jgi:hypothetical protein
MADRKGMTINRHESLGKVTEYFHDYIRRDYGSWNVFVDLCIKEKIKQVYPDYIPVWLENDFRPYKDILAERREARKEERLEAKRKTDREAQRRYKSRLKAKEQNELRAEKLSEGGSVNSTE